MSYFHDRAGRKLSQDERVERALAQRPKRKPAEPPRELTSSQFIASREAEKQGRAEAAAKFAKPPSQNPYARQYAELERTAVTPADFNQLRRMKRWAQQWQRENKDRLEREAKVAALQAQPGYRNAVEHSDAFLRTIDPDYLSAASAARGYLEGSADYEGYWTKVAEIETEIWRNEDAKKLALAERANATLNEFNQQAARTTEAADRIRVHRVASGRLSSGNCAHHHHQRWRSIVSAAWRFGSQVVGRLQYPVASSR